jgi:hypothetical protein
MFQGALGKMNVTTGSKGRFHSFADKLSRGSRRKVRPTQWGYSTTSFGDVGIYLGKPGRKTRRAW